MSEMNQIEVEKASLTELIALYDFSEKRMEEFRNYERGEKDDDEAQAFYHEKANFFELVASDCEDLILDKIKLIFGRE